MLTGSVYVITIFFLLYSLSTNHYMLLKSQKMLWFWFIRYFALFDIVFNFISEHYQDIEVEKFLKKSIKIYLKTTFLSDFLNLIGLFIIDWEFQ